MDVGNVWLFVLSPEGRGLGEGPFNTRNIEH